MARQNLRRMHGASILATILLAGCGTHPTDQARMGEPAPEAEVQLDSTVIAGRGDAVDVEPMTAVAAEPEAMPAARMVDAAPRCVVPRVRDLPAARALLAEQQAARLAAEAERARAAEVAASPAPAGPIALQPSEERAAGDTVEAPMSEPAPLASQAALDPMGQEMVDALDAPLGDGEARPIPAAALPGFDLSAEEAEAAFACISPELEALYGPSGHALATHWLAWERFPQAPILVPDAFGMRWLTVYGNDRAIEGVLPEGYLDRDLPVGAVLAMPSFTVGEDGVVTPGALVLVEKMPRGYSGPYGNWRFTEVPIEGRQIRPLISRGGEGAPDPVVCADCTARGLDAVYLTLVEGGVAPDPERLAPLRDIQRPASWYPQRERTPRQGDVPPAAIPTEPVDASAPIPAEEPVPTTPDITPPVTQTSMRG